MDPLQQITSGVASPQGAQAASSKSDTVATAAEEMSANMSNVAAAMEQSTTNTNIVATAAEEMSATIGEIARHAERARARRPG